MSISEEAADEDLPKQFEIVIARLNEKTGWNLNAKTTATIDQVVAKINTIGKDENPEKHERAKKIWRNTMMCVDRLSVFVQRFGAIIAQGASVAFGPASQCFNAISFVISAAQQYKEVFAKITVLIERVSVFLENLDTFMNDKADVKLDKRLRKTCYRVLEHFVKIMSTTYDLTNSKRARLKLMATSFAFGEDAGVSGSLATLETLVSDFTGAQISVLVSNLSAAAQEIRVVDKKLDNLGEAVEKQTSFLDQLTSSDASRNQQEKEKKDREAVKKALGIDETKTPWDRQGDLWDNRIAGTGQWLLDRPHISKWADRKAIASEFVMLNAPSGYGKSHLSSIIVRHLQDKHRGDPHVVVAFYYVNGDAGDKSSDTLNKMLKTIIWQLARSNKEYAKAAARACEASVDTSSTALLWRKLVTDLSKAVDVTLFLVLDGLDELDNETDLPALIDVIEQVRSTSDDHTYHLRVRAFITGVHEGLNPINEKLDPAVPEINLAADQDSNQPALNQPDLELYVGDRLGRVERLKGLDDALKERIRKELAEGAGGDYSRLLYLLDDLVNVQNTNQIEDILERANQSLEDIIANKVDSLNDSLNNDEISEVNTLLDWTSAGYSRLNVPQLEAILSLKSDSQSLGLEDRIRSKYFELLSVADDKEVTIRAGVEDYLLEQSGSSNTTSEGNRQQTDAIQTAEITLVQKVIQTHFRNVFGDEDIYARFGFDDFFRDKLGANAIEIRLSKAESDLRLAHACMIIVCDKYADARCQVLLKYGYDWFVDHLERLVIDDIEPATKQDMGRKLTRMLQEEVLIDSWWDQERMYLSGYFVFNESSDELIGLIHNFLKDPTVQKGLADMPNERKWVARMTSGDRPDYNIYENIGKVMARRWYDSLLFNEKTQSALNWLVGFIKSRNDITPVESTPPTVEQLQEITEWAKNALGNGDQEGQWHGRLAGAYWVYNLTAEAAKEYRLAIELRPDEWGLRMALAECLGLQEQYKDAIQTLEEVTEQRKDLLGSDDDYTASYWGQLLPDLARWRLALNEYAVAERIYQQILDHEIEQRDLTDNAKDAIKGMLSVLNKQGRYTDAVTFLDHCCSRQDSKNVSWNEWLFRLCCVDDDFHRHLVVAAKRSGMLSAISQRYEAAIQSMGPDSEQDLMRINCAALRYRLANILWTLGSLEQQQYALDLWEMLVYHEPNPTYAPYAGFLQLYSSRNLSSALLAEIKKHSIADMTAADAATHLARLQKLTEVKFDSKQTSKDPRLLLARTYQLSGQSARARDLVRDLLKEAFDQTTDSDNEQHDGYYYIAVILQTINDDDNAMAAWAHCVPVDPEEEQSAEDGGSDNGSEASQETAPTEVSDDDQADGGAEMQADHRKDTGTEPDPPTSIEGDETVVADGKAEELVAVKLQGLLSNYCDGECGVRWTYADDIYACKDCLDIQLDPVCYEKLRAGELDVPICGRDHEFIHIPPFDEQAWRARPQDYIPVAGENVLRSEWADRVRREWFIDEESLKRSDDAARKIQRAWKAAKFHRALAWDSVLAGVGVKSSQA